MYLKLKALCSLTKCFIVVGLIRFLLSSWRCYRGVEAVVGNQGTRAQTLSRWDQLTIIWFQNTLAEEAPGRERPPCYESRARGPADLPSSDPPALFPPPAQRRGRDVCRFKKDFMFFKSNLSSDSKYFFLVPTGLCCPIH